VRADLLKIRRRDREALRAGDRGVHDRVAGEAGDREGPAEAVRGTDRDGVTATFTFEPTPQGTRTSCDPILRLTGWQRLLAPLIAREARRTNARQFRRRRRSSKKGASGAARPG
jgi:hypothetical protein